MLAPSVPEMTAEKRLAAYLTLDLPAFAESSALLGRLRSFWKIATSYRGLTPYLR